MLVVSCKPKRRLNVAGRRFRVGTVNGVKVIYVRCGVGMVSLFFFFLNLKISISSLCSELTMWFWLSQVNAAAATQQLADFFNIRGIVHFGIAGSLDPRISYGDVAVLKRVANTAVYDWLVYIHNCFIWTSIYCSCNLFTGNCN